MCKFSRLTAKRTFGVALFLLTNFANQEVNASVFSESGTARLLDLTVLLPITLSVCLEDGTCSNYEGSWTEWQLPNLQIGQQVSLSGFSTDISHSVVSSSNFAFSLGNSLTGKFSVSLTPFFQGSGPEHDELTANIVDRTSYLATTHAGKATFEANSGGDYYLMLGGLIRNNQPYQLQVSQVPLPAAFWLFGTGLTAVLSIRKRKAYKW